MRAVGSPDSVGFQVGEEESAAERSSARAADVVAICALAFKKRMKDARSVAGQQHKLEKEHSGAPHGGRSAEPRQDDFAMRGCT